MFTGKAAVLQKASIMSPCSRIAKFSVWIIKQKPRGKQATIGRGGDRVTTVREPAFACKS